jgi:hypothetical protein
MAKFTTCTVKTGPNAGAEYYPEVREFFGVKRYRMSAGFRWQNKASDARRDAEAAGAVYFAPANGPAYLTFAAAA